MADNIKKRLKQDFGRGNLFNTEIPTNVAIARAVDEYKPVILTEPQSPGAKAFNNLAEEFVERFYYLKR
jgi:cellulose biosynthesis protein BcsQ